MRPTFLSCVALGLATVIPMAGIGQVRDPTEAIGGPLTGSPVLDAPFSADAITTVRLTLPDGTRLTQKTTARYYRDRAGSTRVELMMEGLGATTVAARHIRTIIAPNGKDVVYPLDPVTRTPRLVPQASDGVYTLDPVTRTTRLLPRRWLAYATGGESAAGALRDSFTYHGKSGFTFAVPIPGSGDEFPVRFLMLRRAQDLLTSNLAPGAPAMDVQDELLGNQLIADVETTGRRITMAIPPLELNNDRAFTMVDERWESAELKMVISAHISDSRMGVVDYRLTNIRRFAPAAELFVMPPDYTLDREVLYVQGTRKPEAYIALIHADRYPRVGIAYADTLPPP